MKIEFTSGAIGDLEELREYLASRSPAGLRNVLSELERSIRQIADNVDIGRATPHEDVREIVVPKYGYVVPYHVWRDTVYILRVYRSARRPLKYKDLL
nr:type II toxin-antitoxin system RelE/ParE family toxin [uncultured Cohaesibacter sp.]